jgi:hypothetical protein
MLIKSVRIGYPSRVGLQFFRVILTYVWLAGLNATNWHKASLPKLENASKIWSQFSQWLIFQVTYINPRDWARTPLIKDVTLVQTNPISLENAGSIDAKTLVEIQKIAIKFSSAFNGLEAKSYFNWLCRYKLMLDSFQECGMKLTSGELEVAEIGPGLAPVTSLLSNSTRAIHSYDTYEMQLVAKYVEESVILPKTKITYHPMNLENGKSAELPASSPYCVIAFYSVTELSIPERAKYFGLIENAEFTLIASNQYFGGVDNFEYIEKLADELKLSSSYKQMGEVFETEIPGYVKNHRIYLLFRKAIKKQLQRID